MPSIRDRNMLWSRKFLFLPIQDVGNMKNIAASDIFTPADGLAADTLVEMGATDIFTYQATATGALDTGSSFVIGPKLIPYDLDPTKNTGVAVVWTHDNTAGATTLTWAVTFGVINVSSGIHGIPNAGATFAVAEPTTALDTTIGAQTSGSANQFVVANTLELLVSTRGVIKAGSAGGNLLLNTAMFWSWRVLLSAGTISSTKIYPLGLLIDYNVKKTWGPGQNLSTGVPKLYLDQSPAPAVLGP